MFVVVNFVVFLSWVIAVVKEGIGEIFVVVFVVDPEIVIPFFVVENVLVEVDSIVVLVVVVAVVVNFVVV